MSDDNKTKAGENPQTADAQMQSQFSILAPPEILQVDLEPFEQEKAKALVGLKNIEPEKIAQTAKYYGVSIQNSDALTQEEREQIAEVYVSQLVQENRQIRYARWIQDLAGKKEEELEAELNRLVQETEKSRKQKFAVPGSKANKENKGLHDTLIEQKTLLRQQVQRMAAMMRHEEAEQKKSGAEEPEAESGTGGAQPKDDGTFKISEVLVTQNGTQYLVVPKELSKDQDIDVTLADNAIEFSVKDEYTNQKEVIGRVTDVDDNTLKLLAQRRQVGVIAAPDPENAPDHVTTVANVVDQRTNVPPAPEVDEDAAANAWALYKLDREDRESRDADIAATEAQIEQLQKWSKKPGLYIFFQEDGLSEPFADYKPGAKAQETHNLANGKASIHQNKKYIRITGTLSSAELDDLIKEDLSGHKVTIGFLEGKGTDYKKASGDLAYRLATEADVDFDNQNVTQPEKLAALQARLEKLKAQKEEDEEYKAEAARSIPTDSDPNAWLPGRYIHFGAADQQQAANKAVKASYKIGNTVVHDHGGFLRIEGEENTDELAEAIRSLAADRGDQKITVGYIDGDKSLQDSANGLIDCLALSQAKFTSPKAGDPIPVGDPNDPEKTNYIYSAGEGKDRTSPDSRLEKLADKYGATVCNMAGKMALTTALLASAGATGGATLAMLGAWKAYDVYKNVKSANDNFQEAQKLKTERAALEEENAKLKEKLAALENGDSPDGDKKDGDERQDDPEALKQELAKNEQAIKENKKRSWWKYALAAAAVAGAVAAVMFWDDIVDGVTGLLPDSDVPEPPEAVEPGGGDETPAPACGPSETVAGLNGTTYDIAEKVTVEAWQNKPGVLSSFDQIAQAKNVDIDDLIAANPDVVIDLGGDFTKLQPGTEINIPETNPSEVCSGAQAAGTYDGKWDEFHKNYSGQTPEEIAARAHPAPASTTAFAPPPPPDTTAAIVDNTASITEPPEVKGAYLLEARANPGETFYALAEDGTPVSIMSASGQEMVTPVSQEEYAEAVKDPTRKIDDWSYMDRRPDP